MGATRGARSSLVKRRPLQPLAQVSDGRGLAVDPGVQIASQAARCRLFTFDANTEQLAFLPVLAVAVAEIACPRLAARIAAAAVIGVRAWFAVFHSSILVGWSILYFITMRANRHHLVHYQCRTARRMAAHLTFAPRV